MSTPTIYKYLLDIFIASRLKTANDGGDPKVIARAHAAYDDLPETDVVFGPIVRNEAAGRYKTSITCKKRNWAATSVSFATGTLKALCGLNIQGVAQLKSLALADRPGVFYIAETDTLYMMTEKDANIFEALKMTGWEIPASAINTVIYPVRKDEIRAVGHVDIDHPIVSGRFMLDYFVRNQAPAPVSTKQSAQTQEVKEGEVVPAADSQQTSEEKPAEETQQPATEETQQPATEEAAPAADTEQTQAPAETQTPTEEQTPAADTPADDASAEEEPTEENTQPAAEEKSSSKSKK